MATAPKEWPPLLLQFHPSALLWLNRLAARRGYTSEKATGWVVRCDCRLAWWAGSENSEWLADARLCVRRKTHQAHLTGAWGFINFGSWY